MTDLIITWPNNCDYPLWRKWLAENSQRFEHVVVVFMESNQGDNYSEFLIENLPGVVIPLFSPQIQPGQDWRDVAVNFGLSFLKNSDAEWVWFTEQDFVPGQMFWVEFEKLKQYGFETIGVMDSERLHPCSLFVKRSVLENTSKDFTAKPPEYDHFGKLQKELTTNITTIDPQHYHHFAGMSHNWRLVTDGEQPNYKPDEFIEYLKRSLACGQKIDDRWQMIAEQAISKHEQKPNK